MRDGLNQQSVSLLLFWSFSPLSLRNMALGSKPNSHHMVGLTGVNSPHHGTSPYHKLSGPVINNRSTSVLGNSENLGATSQELGTENNQILYSKGLTVTSQQSGRSHSKFVTLQIWRTRLLSSVVHRPIVHS